MAEYLNGIGDALVDVFLRAVDDSRPRIRAMTEWLAEAAHPPRGVRFVADDGAEFTGLFLVERNRPIMMLALRVAGAACNEVNAGPLHGTYERPRSSPYDENGPIR